MAKQFYYLQFDLTCHLFAHSLNVKQFYLTHRCYLSGSERTCEQWHCRDYSTFPKAPVLEPCYQMVLCHIQNTYWGGLFFCRDAVSIFYWGSTPLQTYNQYILLRRREKLPLCRDAVSIFYWLGELSLSRDAVCIFYWSGELPPCRARIETG